jgi:hypothetical protein
MQLVSITTNVMSSNLAQAIQYYVIKFASDLWLVRGFLCALCFPPPIKLTPTVIWHNELFNGKGLKANHMIFVGLFHSNAGKNFIYNLS